ncbi:HAMP domain-containing sensor histidine kinase [Campylobacter sp. US33a]|uniref:histidine kinase n=1 Tax=Campylobacter sp. CCS1377 TaxID=3158229 RepID=A0AAU7EB09_9BACT|nr:HAMP domain-containing sensor histidine kinase [Campylobacter sp. US33a]TEY02438.1 sensor histidine kinase [Campylobacter sp. US33a]
MSEAKSVIRQILLIYLTTTGVFLSIFFGIWYEKLYEELISEKSINLKEYHRNIVIGITNSRFVPLEQSAADIAKDSELKFAIFDRKKVFFSNLDYRVDEITLKYRGQGGRDIYKNTVFFIAPLSSSHYYLRHFKNFNPINEEKINKNGLKILIQGFEVSKELFLIRLQVFLSALLSFVLIGIISYFLVKIALRPLENKIHTLNRFIKDSTHEINTPLSVILMSVEQLERQDQNNSPKFKRIKLAAKTLNQIYSDLVFYNFPNTIAQDKVHIDMKNLILERLEYFKLFFEQKKIELVLNLNDNNTLFANKNRIAKMLDNLLSNAIKYNKKSGKIYISLSENILEIKDTGCGIDKQNLKNIFERYARFNQDQGGFGIGLALVKNIAKEYEISVECQSVPNEGSSFILKW